MAKIEHTHIEKQYGCSECGQYLLSFPKHFIPNSCICGSTGLFLVITCNVKRVRSLNNISVKVVPSDWGEN